MGFSESFLLLLGLLCPPPAPAVSLQETGQEAGTQGVDERPEVKASLEALANHIKAKGLEDPKAIEVMDQLVLEFPASGPKDRAAIVKQLADCFDVKRTKEREEGVPDDRLFVAAAGALGTMAPESVKPLIALLGDKNHRKNLRLQQSLAQSLGRTKDPEALKPLLSLLKHKDAVMQAAGAEALANFSDAALETRKVIFEALLNTMMDQKAKKDNVTDLEAQERWNIISGPILSTLQKLSAHGETDPDLWLRWWNDNKKKDWGAKAG